MSRLLLLAGAVVLIAGVYFGYTNYLAPVSTPTPPPPVDTSRAGADVVSAEGSIIPAKSAALGFKILGRVVQAPVKEGDTVKQGQTLARLDDAVAQKQIAQAQAAVSLAQKQSAQLASGGTEADRKAAQAALEAAQQNFKRAQGGATEADRAAARAALDAAQQNYARVSAGGTEADRAAAQAALEAALQNLARVKAGPTVDELAQLKALVDNARALLDQAQAAYDKIGGATNPNIGQLPQSAQLQQATNNYNAALAAYNNARAHPTTAELAAAQGQVQQAQAALDRLNATPAQVAAALEQVQQAQAAVARLESTAAELAAAQGQVEQAQAALARLSPTKEALDVAQAQVAQAQAALEVAQAQAADTILTAPFDGTISQKSIEVGNVVGPGAPAPAFVLGDLAHLQIETSDLAEVDAPKVQVGQEARVTLDAFADKMFHAKVARIATAASDHRGDKVFRVTLDLEEGIESGLRWGMTAHVEITVKPK